MLCVELLIKCSKECRWRGAERSRLCVRKTAELMLCWWREAASAGVKEKRQKLRALCLILLSQMGDAALNSAEWERLQQLVAVALLEWAGSPFPPLRKNVKAKKGTRALTKKNNKARNSLSRSS